MRWLDPTHLINTFGVVGMVAVIFAESGLFFGFFLPGESLLVTAGLLASTHRPGAVHLNIVLVVMGAACWPASFLRCGPSPRSWRAPATCPTGSSCPST
jgi:membrane protein DedA with SNARE-associated domain